MVRKEPCECKECYAVEMAQIRFTGSPQLGARMEDLGIGFILVRPFLCLLQLRAQRIWDMEIQATKIVTEHVESMKKLN